MINLYISSKFVACETRRGTGIDVKGTINRHNQDDHRADDTAIMSQSTLSTAPVDLDQSSKASMKSFLSWHSDKYTTI